MQSSVKMTNDVGVPAPFSLETGLNFVRTSVTFTTCGHFVPDIQTTGFVREKVIVQIRSSSQTKMSTKDEMTVNIMLEL